MLRPAAMKTVSAVVLVAAIALLGEAQLGSAADPYPIFWDVFGTGNESRLATQYHAIRPENETQTGNLCTQPHCKPWTQGLWPAISSLTGTIYNGGVPQAANLTAHLEEIRATIDQWMPDPEWQGNAVLDFECWTTVWELNTDDNPAHDLGWHDIRYRNYSIELVRRRHPTWTPDELEAQAKKEFESAAATYFISTLDLLHSLRPRARFGFYGFPQGFLAPCSVSQSGAEAKCGYDDPVHGETLRAYVQKQLPIYAASKAFYPSIYMYKGYNATMQRAYVTAILSETVRLRTALNRTTTQPIYAFQMAVYHQHPPTLLSPEALRLGFELPYNYGADGVVMWWATNGTLSTGSHHERAAHPLRKNTVESATYGSFAEWIEKLFGPMAQSFHDRADQCQKRYCQSAEAHLRCKSLDMHETTAERPSCVPIVL